MQPGGVVPVHPAEGGQLDVLDALPRAGSGGSVDQLGLVVAVDRLGEGAVVGVGDRADRWDGANLGEAFAVAQRRALRAASEWHRSPTIVLEQASTTEHTQATPAQVGTYVRSHPQLVGRGGGDVPTHQVEVRAAPRSAFVVRTRVVRRAPSMPISRISRATWSRPTSGPDRRAAFHSLRASAGGL